MRGLKGLLMPGLALTSTRDPGGPRRDLEWKAEKLDRLGALADLDALRRSPSDEARKLPRAGGGRPGDADP